MNRPSADAGDYHSAEINMIAFISIPDLVEFLEGIEGELFKDLIRSGISPSSRVERTQLWNGVKNTVINWLQTATNEGEN